MNIKRIEAAIIAAVNDPRALEDFPDNAATKAVIVLIEEGLLVEKDNGDLDVDLSVLLQFSENVRSFVSGVLSCNTNNSRH